ncbi:AlpA family phage regulatory protein [bacterium]|jgi:predicted DNA-binding transcriptional regulator AlpA|nr:AlpA family phage regulatory protein [bacterium]
MTSLSKMMKAKDVAEWLGVSESAIYKWVGDGDFPKPYKLGNADAQRAASRWDRKEIEAWLENRRDR